MTERRRAPRRPAQAHAYLIAGKGPRFRCRLTNIGPHGARLEPRPPSVPVGSRVELAVVLRVEGVVRVRRVHAVIANRTAQGLGVEFRTANRERPVANAV
jgi:hypothetical protein